MAQLERYLFILLITKINSQSESQSYTIENGKHFHEKVKSEAGLWRSIFTQIHEIFPQKLIFRSGGHHIAQIWLLWIFSLCDGILN